ncbi:MAG: hypothetical protein DI551_00230 [Micavibrio aeruginosavorus]|uniref:Lipoprotein n=1 Tax=Micavibrio aeruginosavorus TaxID=349221 RepID=A0A2W5N6M9_9BACT|nr:MAG: hypothetical protein DI551_00230 [Micavibrio aeruginosavorus]
MTLSLKGRFAKAVAGVAIAMSLAACQSTADINAKPDIINGMTEDAIALCDQQKSASDEMPYETRLRNVLSEVSPSTLRYFKENKITICLDKRLGSLQTSGMESTPIAIYYPSQKNPVLTLRDNGKNTEVSRFMSWDASTFSSTTTSKFTGAYGGFWGTETPAAKTGERMISYRGGCGKGCTTSHWVKESNWRMFGGGFQHASVDRPPILSVN